jgi:hypothetical protein
MPIQPVSTAGTPSCSFPHDTTILSAEARAQVRAAVQAYQANGGQGFIRVVGHSSSSAHRKHDRAAADLIWNFERSQARAKAVAQELIREGVPADKVLVEAVGDSAAGRLRIRICKANTASAPAALRLRRGQPPQGGGARARRRHHRFRHGQSRHADAQAHRRQAGRAARDPRPTAIRRRAASRACAAPWPATTSAASA